MDTLLRFELTRTARASCQTAAMVFLTLALQPVTQAAVVSGQGNWEATLEGRDLDGNIADGFEAYYDKDLNITWMTDAHVSAGGPWDTVQTWVSNLNVNGVTGWRLPVVKPVNGSSFQYGWANDGSTDAGANITSKQSELAHLYYVTLGNKAVVNTAGQDQPGWGLTNTGPFKNISGTYWSGTGDNVPYRGYAWYFSPYDGRQNYGGKNLDFSAWAVHDGDVGIASSVPEPDSFVLLSVGLAAALTARYSQRNQSGV